MNKIFITILLFLTLTSCVFSSQSKPENKIIRRIKIRSADPRLIALLLAGHQNYNLSPEQSHGASNLGNNQSGNGNSGTGSNGSSKGN